ncbi:hypothetical protein SK3146_01164 [Paenibacillus konkukensis]|uniref:Uncharacterized protein n=1 Tax=Paenibacillus konkukensis TaxID=2020716 RepID=A0ABY4RIJ7_9BACL|nr:hypothetical protein [Paenibacillus konkukensis]UQZ82007.1 hypothetical protein SK3146_01164 [Paenibacillus konkukensis]
MNKSKWFKWKIGAVSALCMGIVFHQVKAGPAFESAHEKAVAEKSGAAAQEQSSDKATGQPQVKGLDRATGDARSRNHRGIAGGDASSEGGQSWSGSPGSGDPSPQTRTQTRTGRS